MLKDKIETGINRIDSLLERLSGAMARYEAIVVMYKKRSKK